MQLGVAPRVLWGWQPEVTHVHEYEDGKLTASRVVTEHAWDEEQRLMLVEFMRYQRGIGPNGFPVAETTSPLADPANPDGEWRYFADPLPVVDYAEKARLDAQDAYRKSLGDGGSMNGLIFTVEKIEGHRPKLL